jgi:hypothetical protein
LRQAKLLKRLADSFVARAVGQEQLFVAVVKNVSQLREAHEFDPEADGEHSATGR